MTRYMLNDIVVVLLMVGVHVLVQTQYLVDKRGALEGKALHGHAFRNLTMATIVECFLSCLIDCVCMTFQMRNDTECQLLSSNRFQTPSALSSLPGCTYYDMLPIQSKQFQDDTIKSPICTLDSICSMASNPCLNGGTWEPALAAQDTGRFRCRCLAVFTGNFCQYPVTSCRGYVNGSRISGKYEVLDDNMKPFQVYCDFDVNSSMAWTLIQSYQLQNKRRFFKTFSLNDPVNEETPVWDSYRLSKFRMKSIQKDSSNWRMTCQYDRDGVVYTDYVRVDNDKINILTYDGEACLEVEYINIRGHNCFNCSSWVVQETSSKFPLHCDSYHSVKRGCDFQPKGSSPCYDSGEDNFGFFNCKNSAHRCSATETSTSQTWLGSH